MKTFSTRFITFFLSLLFVLPCCGGGDSGGGGSGTAVTNPFSDYVPDPETYTLAPDPNKILTVTDASGEMKFPSDHVLVSMKAGTSQSDAQKVATDIGGKIVGQVPAVDLYQIQIPNTTTRAQLDAAIAKAELDANVDYAFYNLLTQDNADCPPLSDLEGLALNERCPFADIGYYEAITIFEGLRPHITLNPVKVAVIDSGIQTNNGEFDNVKILNLDNPGVTISDTNGHGTRVAGVIAADDDQGVNGIASRFLKDKLLLMWGGASYATVDRVAAVKRAADAGAKVVNLSFSYKTFSTTVTKYSKKWKETMAKYPDILFVASAPNKAVQLTAINNAPAGIQMDNLIAVGGTALCKPLEAWSESAFGPSIDIAASAEDVPVVGKTTGSNYSTGSGNSYAAPQVASLAAILRSLNPKLSAKEIKKDYILTYTSAAAATLGGQRLNLPIPIEQLLIDLKPSAGQTVLNLIDLDGDGTFDVPGMVVNRICGGLNYKVDGYGSYQYNAKNDKTWIWGIINTSGFAISTPAGVTISDALLTLNCFICSFKIGTSFSITDSATANPGTAEMGYTQNQANLGSSPFGTGVSGSWNIDSCRIVERDLLFNQPLWVQVQGSFTGVLKMMDPPKPNLHNESIKGYFDMLFSTLGLVNSGSPLVNYLEANCQGGNPTP